MLHARRLPELIAVALASILFGYLLSLARLPLPWMIGPMLVTAAASILGHAPALPASGRIAGQVVVAATVGLYFTPGAVELLAGQAGLMVVAALSAILVGLLSALVLTKLSGIGYVTASLCCVPGGPVEMAEIAGRSGGDPGIVAFAHILRLSMLMLVIPPIVTTLDGTARAPVSMAAATGTAGAALLLAIAVAAGLALRLLRFTTPFFLGPLAAGAAATALQLPVAAPPWFVLAAAQILLGMFLGCMFRREMIRSSPRLVLALLLSTAMLALFTACVALALGWLGGTPWQTMILATAPGGITEMALTAKLLGQQVALVTAYHILRIFVVLLLVPPAFPLILRLGRRFAGQSAQDS
jgi:membrane AbrB-like protein